MQRIMSKTLSFPALRVPVFRNYLFGAFISEMGNQMQTVAVAWQIYELTRNPLYLGLIGVANFVPIMIFSLFGGLAADKLDRRKLLICSLFVQTVMALILFYLSQTNQISPTLIYLILFFVATAQSFSVPARSAIFPNLVPRQFFMNAVSLHTLQFQSATLIGPAVAGFLIAGLSVSTVYLVNAFSFTFFIVSVLLIKVPVFNHDKIVAFNLNSLKEGVKFVISTPILYSTMVLDFLATFFGTATILMPVFAKDVLQVGPAGLGLLYSAPAVGGVAAGLILSSLNNIKNQGKIILGAVLLYGAATIGFGMSKFLPLSIFFLILVGLGDMTSSIVRNTVRQMITPDHLRGRMVSIMRLFFQGGPQLGEIEAGFLAKVIGGPATVVVGGVGVILITSLIAWKNKSLRNFHHGKDDNLVT